MNRAFKVWRLSLVIASTVPDLPWTVTHISPLPTPPDSDSLSAS